MDKNERLQEIEKEIALLMAEKAQLNRSPRSFDDLKNYFGEKCGEMRRSKGGTLYLHGHRGEAWDCLRRLSIYSVCGGDERKRIKDLTIEEWKKARETLEKLIDYYVENVEDP